MSEDPKLDGMLNSLVDQIGAADPDFGVDVEITPRHGEVVAEVEDQVAQAGGTVRRAETDRLSAHIPVGRLIEIAGQPAVRFIRLSRRSRPF